MISIISKNKKRQIRLWAVAFWLLIWQAASIAIGQEILLVSPVAVLQRLKTLVWESTFWLSCAFSVLRIVSGFLLGTALGVVLGGVSFGFCRIRELLAPLVLTMKSIPVASFVILVLIWIPSKNLSVFISFFMVFPVVYTNVIQGIESVDKKLLEMAQVFQVSRMRKIRYIYLSQVLPFFRSGCCVALGLCWKAGVAAEVIGIPDGSIGEHLYQAKVYLDTPDLFAWTVVIIVISLLFEKVFLGVIDWGIRKLERR